MAKGNLSDYRIILASRSPRRHEMLMELGIDHEVIVKDYIETFPGDLEGEEIALYLASSKARSFRGEISDRDIVVTADTIVWCNREVLGKPRDEEDARRILGAISGKTHQVITGVCIYTSFSEITFADTTKVTFDTLSGEEISYYISRFKPFDKAGAYGIQEWIGLIGCSRIEGSYFNVVGLPVNKLYRELQKITSSSLLKPGL